MVGEMRDRETAENAIQAALTGHLVLSTLHTNDAPLAVTRMVDIGIPRFLIHATLIGVLAQRLLRRICPHCVEAFDMDAEDLKAMGIELDQRGSISLKRGRGCIRCRGTGYLGRVGIFEVLTITEPIRELIDSGASAETLRQAACKEGMVTLRENAVGKMLEGQTTYQEVIRVTWEQM
jgi:general secretion pathway protein E